MILDRDVVLVRGPDATSFLQGQLSQDVAGLEVGASAFSFLLQPQGKVDAWLRVTRVADDEYALDVDAGWGEHVVARLKRFLLRVKVDVEPVDWSVDGRPDEAAAVLRSEPSGEVDDVERERIAAGIPRMGAEIDESTIPASTGMVERSVSFTKGCYTGQELVARIDSRGDRVPTKLRRIAGITEAGATLLVGEAEVGRVTSAVDDVALAYVRREVELPVDAVDDAGRPVRIDA